MTILRFPIVSLFTNSFHALTLSYGTRIFPNTPPPPGVPLFINSFQGLSLSLSDLSFSQYDQPTLNQWKWKLQYPNLPQNLCQYISNYLYIKCNIYLCNLCTHGGLQEFVNIKIDWLFLPYKPNSCVTWRNLPIIL